MPVLGAHVVERCPHAVCNAYLERTSHPSFENMCAPRTKTGVSWVSRSATLLPGGSHSGTTDLVPIPVMTQLPFPSKWEARGAQKCSWSARVNQTFCRSLVRSLAVLGAHVMERSLRASWNAHLGRTTTPALKTFEPPGQRLQFPESVAQLPCCPGWHHGYQFNGSPSWPR